MRDLLKRFRANERAEIQAAVVLGMAAVVLVWQLAGGALAWLVQQAWTGLAGPHVG